MTPARGISAALQRFMQQESSAGFVLAAAAVVAMLVSNSPAAPWMAHLLHAELGFSFEPLWGARRIGLPVHAWVNDLLMAVFFLLVGLEIKRERLAGELATASQALLPAVGAVGGMLVPAGVYVLFNAGDAVAMRGWAVPMATDIAFALGIVTLLGPRVPPALKVFLTALAIIDDLGAILVIALFYTQGVDLAMLAAAGGCVGLLVLLNRAGVGRLDAYLLVGAALWVCVFRAGLHPTLAGVLTALAIPMRARDGSEPLARAEHALHPWVAFFILPVFALANAGVSLAGLTPGQLLAPLPLGIAAGLVLGKLGGVAGASWLFLRLRAEPLPGGASWPQMLGVCLLCGIGFTMSLFIGQLAFASAGDGAITALKLGVLGGSLLAGCAGATVMAVAGRRTA